MSESVYYPISNGFNYQILNIAIAKCEISLKESDSINGYFNR